MRARGVQRGAAKLGAWGKTLRYVGGAVKTRYLPAASLIYFMILQYFSLSLSPSLLSLSLSLYYYYCCYYCCY